MDESAWMRTASHDVEKSGMGEAGIHSLNKTVTLSLKSTAEW
jgi:hypothetical protein